MLNYILRRVLGAVPTLLVISIVIFVLLELAPGDAADALVPADMAGAMADNLRSQLGLDRPPYERYLGWMAQVLQGNMGYSLVSGRPVVAVILDRLPATLELVFASLIFSTVAGVGLGIVSALKRHTATDHVLTLVGMIGLSIPEFFSGILCIFLFSIHLEWLPLGGRHPLGDYGLWERISHVILPAFVMGFTLVAALMRYTRASFLETMNQQFVQAAFSKGLSRWRVYIVHVLRNAAIPIVVILTFRLLLLFEGAVVIENVFSWPGMGTLIVEAITNRDYPIVLGVLTMLSFLVVVISLLADIFTALVDPHIRLG
jgi:peptide/nickel transport system permease protein